MNDPKASIMIIAVVSLLSFSIACACGSLHLGEDLSQQIIPTSLTSSDDMIKPIKENNFTATKISIIQPTTKKNTTRNYTRNTTNTTNNTTENTSNNYSATYNYQNHTTSSGNYSDND